MDSVDSGESSEVEEPANLNNEQLLIRVQELEATVVDLEERVEFLSTFEEANIRLQDEIDQVRSEKESLTVDIEELTRESEQQKTETEALMAEIQQLKQQSEDLELQLNEAHGRIRLDSSLLGIDTATGTPLVKSASGSGANSPFVTVGSDTDESGGDVTPADVITTLLTPVLKAGEAGTSPRLPSMDALVDTFKAKETELDELKAKCQSLTDELDLKNSELETSKVEIEKLENDLDEITRENADLRLHLIESSQREEDLEQENIKTLESLHERMVSSMVAKEQLAQITAESLSTGSKRLSSQKTQLRLRLDTSERVRENSEPMPSMLTPQPKENPTFGRTGSSDDGKPDSGRRRPTTPGSRRGSLRMKGKRSSEILAGIDITKMKSRSSTRGSSAGSAHIATLTMDMGDTVDMIDEDESEVEYWTAEQMDIELQELETNLRSEYDHEIEELQRKLTVEVEKREKLEHDTKESMEEFRRISESNLQSGITAVNGQLNEPLLGSANAVESTTVYSCMCCGIGLW